MNIAGITAAGVCICVLILAVKNIRSDIGQVISIAATVVICAAIIPFIITIISAMQDFAELSRVGGEFLTPVLKITGIAYISQIGADLCIDSGETSLAKRIEAAGKIGITVIALPLAKDAFMKIMEILL